MPQAVTDTLENYELLLAGRRTSPGRYRELGTGRIVELSQEDTLPATLDGRIACYIRLFDWGQVASCLHRSPQENTRGEMRR